MRGRGCARSRVCAVAGVRGRGWCSWAAPPRLASPPLPTREGARAATGGSHGRRPLTPPPLPPAAHPRGSGGRPSLEALRSRCLAHWHSLSPSPNHSTERACRRPDRHVCRLPAGPVAYCHQKTLTHGEEAISALEVGGFHHSDDLLFSGSYEGSVYVWSLPEEGLEVSRCSNKSWIRAGPRPRAPPIRFSDSTYPTQDRADS